MLLLGGRVAQTIDFWFLSCDFNLVPNEWRIIRTAHETLISIKLSYFGVKIELFSQHTISESKQFANLYKKF